MDMEQAKQLFISEAEELLDSMERCLLDVESGEAGISEHIDAIFRAAHTIKGSAGLFGFDNIVAFTHNVESVLDKVRSDLLPFNPELASTMLDCQQHMLGLIAALSDADLLPPLAQGEALIAELNRYLQPKGMTAVPHGDSADIQSNNEQPNQYWHINVDYGADVFRDGMDPASQLRFLQTLGAIKHTQLSCHFPDDDSFDPESCYLSLAVDFDSTAEKRALEDVFEFIQDSSKVSIRTPPSLIARVQAYPEDTERLGEVLVNSGAVTERELSAALKAQQHALLNQQAADNIGAMLVKQGVIESGLVDAALTRQKHQEHKKPADFQFLKVDAKKLDHLINLIGELVTAGAANELLISRLTDEKMEESFSAMVLLIEQIRDGALGLRMVQIGDSFGRLKRIVRDVSKELGKDIQLDILGADTELDKSMVEKLSDPLMHIVRNAIDHGIEQKEVRQYKGKPAHGTLRLNAYHEAGAVVIEIGDDGAGLNSEKILAKALEKGLVQSNQLLSKEEACKLIFAPGFSTASSVTNLSGRGVGMDVVKRNIEELRGQITIDTELDKGTTFKIRLPLTLAIIDGFEVSVGDAHLVIPVNMIKECLAFESELMTVDRDYLNLRGEVLPFVRVRETLRIQPTERVREHIVVVQFGDHKAGLVVEGLHGELQAVIKPLNEMFRSIRGIGGSTILGSGDIGFILDVPQLIDFARNKESKRYQSDSVTTRMTHE